MWFTSKGDRYYMKIGILAIDLKDYHESVKEFYNPLNLTREKNDYYLLDLRISPIVNEDDITTTYDKVQLSKGVLAKIDQYMRVRRNQCKIE